MKVDTMRIIDRYVGIPLCLIISGLFKLTDKLFKVKAKSPKKVLFIELSEMGSAILVDPAMRWLKNQNCEPHFVIFKDNAVSLDLLNTIAKENIYTLNPSNLFTLARDTLKFLLWCRKKNIDTVIDLELFSRVTSLISRMSGAVNRIGYHSVHEEGLYRGNHLTHPVMYNPHIHISKNFMVLVQSAFQDKNQPYQKVHISDNDIKLARARVTEKQQNDVIKKIQTLAPDFERSKQRLILINPNASDLLPQRRWMKDSFSEVMRQIIDNYSDTLVIITGSPSEKENAETIKNDVDRERCLNTAGLFKFSELVPLYSLATLMLSNDSGPPHFASVTDLPTFVIFGPETPKIYGALGNSTPIYANLACSPCVSAGNHRKTTCTDNQCLKSIQTDHVLNILKPSLDNIIVKR